MLSLSCKTAVKAVIYLSGKSGEGEKANIREISAKINASEHTVGKILQQLSRRKIINSLKGPSGGFYLSEDQQEQPIINIVKAIEADAVFTECGLGLGSCSAARPCPIHDRYEEARELMENIFRGSMGRNFCNLFTCGSAYLIN